MEIKKEKKNFFFTNFCVFQIKPLNFQNHLYFTCKWKKMFAKNDIDAHSDIIYMLSFSTIYFCEKL